MTKEDIKKVVLNEIVNDLKVMRVICYPNEEIGVNCKNCEHYNMCTWIFGSNTPKIILDNLKEKGLTW